MDGRRTSPRLEADGQSKGAKAKTHLALLLEQELLTQNLGGDPGLGRLGLDGDRYSCRAELDGERSGGLALLRREELGLADARAERSKEKPAERSANGARVAIATVGMGSEIGTHDGRHLG